MVLGVSETRGLPIEIIPPNNWDGEGIELTIIAQDSSGNIEELQLFTRLVNYSWGTHPLISGLVGDKVNIKIHGTNSETVVIDSQNGRLDWSERGWILPVIGNLSGSLTIDGISEIEYLAMGYENPSRLVFCQINGEIGNIEANCNFLNGSTDFEFGAYLIADDGSIIDNKFGIIPKNTSAQINLSSEGWNPSPGNRVLKLRVLDSSGREIGTTTSENKIKEESKVLMMRSFILSHLDLNAIDKYDETPLIVQKIEDIAGDGESDKLGIFWAISDLVCSQIDEELISFSDIFSSKGLIDRSEDLKEAAEMIYELNISPLKK